MISHSRQQMLNEMAAGKTRGKGANPEMEHQISYFDILRANERTHPEVSLIFAIPNGGFRSAKTAALLRMQGVKAGVSDVFLPFPRNGRHGCWIELKIRPNKPTEMQTLFLEAMLCFGYETHVAWSCDEMCEITERYLGIKLNR